jgi:hypothetical protein
MIDLPHVTLCCVDTRHADLALQALQRCMAGLRFAHVLFFTDARTVGAVPDGVRVIDLAIASSAAYSHFMLRGLATHVHTSHVLVVQWDGFVLDPERWDPAFLQWDYIGPQWHDAPPGFTVGNGGFSLRSARLLQALQDTALEPTHPEDVCIGQQHRTALETRHGIRFAPPEVADRFGFERVLPSAPTFGFHGLMNVHRVMRDKELHSFLDHLPEGLASTLDAHDLCSALIGSGDVHGAEILLDKRWRNGMRDRRTVRLALRLWLHRLAKRRSK